MQWGIVTCCPQVGAGSCIESIAGVFQLFLQWFLFTIILVLYMIYFPPHLKFAEVDVDLHDNRPPHHIKTSVKSDSWRLSIILSWVVLVHMALVTFVTFFLLTTNPSPDPTYRSHQIAIWVTFLGVASALLAVLQYAPQIVHTYRMKLVGALSIKMMLIQSPGALLMVLSIALRPGTNWTTWLPYAVAGAMQCSLLIMCLAWQTRQQRLGIDDFGNPVLLEATQADSPVTVIRRPDDQVSIAEAVEVAVEEDILETHPGEETPLLTKGAGRIGPKKGWLDWLRR